MPDIEELIGQINNEVDLETFGADDDSFGGGGFNTNQPHFNSAGHQAFRNSLTNEQGIKEPQPNMVTGSDGNSYEKTGIIVNLSDDDSFTPHISMLHPKDLENIKKPVSDNIPDGIPPEEMIYNEVDMETYCGEDDDHFEGEVSSTGMRKEFNFDDEDDFEVDPQLVFEEKRSKTKRVSTGEVEDDYWEKLKKKHSKTVVKGAAPYHLRVGGFDPEKEMELLNHDLTPNGNPFKQQVIGAVDTDFSYGDGDVGSSEGSADGSVGGDSGASGGSVGGESLNKNNYTKLFESLIDMIGFKVTKKDNSYLVEDLYTDGNAFNCSCTKDIVERLDTYIRDFTILGLQESTGNKLNSYKEWSDWYRDEQKAKYPKSKRDIEYCDLIANHLNDIKL